MHWRIEQAEEFRAEVEGYSEAERVTLADAYQALLRYGPLPHPSSPLEIHRFRDPRAGDAYALQSFAVVGECCGLRNRPQSAPTRSAMASAEEPAGLRTAKFRRYTLSFDNVL